MLFFASVAIFLAALGLYGIMAYAVIGVRLALGAGKADVFRLIIGSGMRLTLMGAIVGVPAALILTRLMGGLSGVTGTSPVTHAAAVAVLAAAALLASSLPARRAMRVDPLVALRAE